MMDTWSGEPRKPLYTPSSSTFSLRQASRYPERMSVVSWNVNTAYLVCAENRAVGTGHTSQPAADRIGIAAVSEHLPYPHMSCTAATRGM